MAGPARCVTPVTAKNDLLPDTHINQLTWEWGRDGKYRQARRVAVVLGRAYASVVDAAAVLAATDARGAPDVRSTPLAQSSTHEVLNRCRRRGPHPKLP